MSANLEKLVLYGNRIEAIQGLEVMVKLREFNLKKNKITGNSLKHLAGNANILLSLENLNLSYNQISD